MATSKKDLKQELRKIGVAFTDDMSKDELEDLLSQAAQGKKEAAKEKKAEAKEKEEKAVETNPVKSAQAIKADQEKEPKKQLPVGLKKVKVTPEELQELQVKGLLCGYDPKTQEAIVDRETNI